MARSKRTSSPRRVKAHRAINSGNRVVHPALEEIARQLYVWADEWLGDMRKPLPCDPQLILEPSDQAHIFMRMGDLYHAIRDSRIQDVSTPALDAATAHRPTLTLIQGGSK